MALTEVRIREPEVAINVQDHVRKLHGAQEIPALALASHFNRSFMQVDCSCHFFFFFLTRCRKSAVIGLYFVAMVTERLHRHKAVTEVSENCVNYYDVFFNSVNKIIKGAGANRPPPSCV